MKNYVVIFDGKRFIVHADGVEPSQGHWRFYINGKDKKTTTVGKFPVGTATAWYIDR